MGTFTGAWVSDPAAGKASAPGARLYDKAPARPPEPRLLTRPRPVLPRVTVYLPRALPTHPSGCCA